MIRILSFPAAISAGVAVTSSFREFVSGTIAGIESVGLVNTYASGTINTGTVLPPNNASQYRGYAVFRFADSLQSQSPVFIKIEFGSGLATARAALAFQVGQIHDGSGTLYRASTRRLLPAAVDTPTQLQYFSGDSSRLAFMLNNTHPTATLSQAAMFFAIQRTRDIYGVDNGNGVLFVQATRGANNFNTYLCTSESLPSNIAEGTNWAFAPANSADNTFASFASNTMSLWFPFPIRDNFPMEDVLIGNSSYFRSEQVVNVSLGNRTVPYFVCANDLTIGPQTATQNQVFMRFE
jgi:hypothetical protein